MGPSTRKTHTGRTLDTRSSAQSLLLSVIRASIATKSYIVTIDEKETGLRNLVNFGHTIGHAIEAVVTPDVLHGECVAVGMILEAEVSRSLGHLGNAAVGRLARCLKAHGLPVTLQDPIFQKSPKSTGLKVQTLLEFMKVDKKNAGAVKKIVLLSRIGKTLEERATGVEDDVIAKILSPALRVFPGVPSQGPSFSLATPGSKSISNRALVLAALGKGQCKLSNLLHSDDTQVMMNALELMKGAEFEWEDNGETLVITGGEGRLSVSNGFFFVCSPLTSNTSFRHCSSLVFRSLLLVGKSSISAMLALPRASSPPFALSSNHKLTSRILSSPEILECRSDQSVP